MKKILRKNLYLVKQYGIWGSVSIYSKALTWYLCHILSGRNTRHRKIRVNNYDMYINLKDKGISRGLFIYGGREKDQMYIIENNLRRGAKVLDIGANIGYYVILESSLMNPSAKIIAYEPSAENYSLLKKNIELNNLNNRVEANNAAVSDKSGLSRFYLSAKSNLHTLNPVQYRGAAQRVGRQVPVDVRTVGIYEIISKHRDIKFVRMDIEGHEVEVLGGLAKAARDFNVYPDILFETHFSKYDPKYHNMQSKLEMLFELGYFPKVLASGNERMSKLKQKGYKPDTVISTDRVERGIYEGVSKEDTLDLICNSGGVRAAFLRKG